MEHADCCEDHMLECPVEYAVGLASGWGGFQGGDGTSGGGSGGGGSDGDEKCIFPFTWLGKQSFDKILRE